MVITISVTEEQVRRAEARARPRPLQTRHPDHPRASEIGRAIDALFLAECPVSKTNDVPEATEIAA